MTTASMPGVEDAREIADAVLFEGYMLYPYRANDAKNRVRWQFGVLAPPGYTELDPSERSCLHTELLLEGPKSALTVLVRFLQVQRRIVEQAVPGRTGASGYQEVDSLDVGPATYLPWDEATVQELTLSMPTERPAVLHVDGGTEIEELRDENGVIRGRLVRTREPVDAVLTAQITELPGPYGVRKAEIELANRTVWAPVGKAVGAQRPDALRHSLVAAHLLLSVSGGTFISQLDPPEWASGYVAECHNIGAFPVLAGPAGARDLVLAAPIILYDHPQVAPESAMSFCDATEMDEMLTLRTMTLTEQEKRQVRGSDPRAAELMSQLDEMPPELIGRLHGAIRSMSSLPRPIEATAPDARPPWWDPGTDNDVSPETDSLLVGGIPVRAGEKVLLRPGRRRADAQDMFLAGRVATVAAVFFDVDGGNHVAVVLDDLADLADEMPNPHGRYLYFQPDEIEPLGVRS